MPSASVKPCENPNPQESSDPLYKVSLLMEKKIRNLEKRKNKLEHYKEELNQGKTLNEDQQHAIKAYDTVLASLDLCREFSTQISEVMTENVNLLKVQLKKQQEEKAHHEYERIKQVLKVQDVLSRLGQEEVRDDFLSGNNGAIRISEDKLSHLDELFKLLTPNGEERTKANSVDFKNKLNKCAENMLALLDGKNKPAGKTTFREMKTLIYQVANCSYPKSNKEKENSSSHSSTPNSEPESNRKKSKKKKENEPESVQQEPQECSETPSPIEPADQPIQEPTNTRDSSVCSNSTNGLSNTENVNKPQSSLMEAPPPGLAPHSMPAPTVVAPAVSVSSGSDLRTPLVHMSPSNLNPSASSPVGPQILTNQPYFNHSTMPPTQSQLSQFSMDINDLVTSSRFNFLQESHVSQVPEQSSVYIDPAVVSFGSIKPENLIHLHEQPPTQKLPPPPQLESKLPSSQTMHQGVILGSSVAPHSDTISTETFVNKKISLGSDYAQSSSIYQNNSDLSKVKTSLTPSEIPSATQREKSPPRHSSKITESSSWAEQANSHLSQSNQSDFDGWGEPINGAPDDAGWVESSGEKSNFTSDFSADSDRKNTYRNNRGNMRGLPRGGGMGNGGYRGGRGGSGYSYQGGNRNNSFGTNNFRGNRGPPMSSGYRGRGGNNSRGNGTTTNRGFRGAGGRGGSGTSFQSSRGQF